MAKKLKMKVIEVQVLTSLSNSALKSAVRGAILDEMETADVEGAKVKQVQVNDVTE